jgi:EAL domain-containing protein (putative c-di-GMP-specific phosphodiesterase class I)
MVGATVAAAAAVLEFINPNHSWLLFEDVSCSVAPAVAAIAVAEAAARGAPEYLRFRASLAIALALTAVGQVVADIPDILGTAASFGPVSEACYVVGTVIGVATVVIALIRRLDQETRRAALLDGMIVMAGAMTIMFATWLSKGNGSGLKIADLVANPTENLLLPLVSAGLLASAAATALAALYLRVELSRRGVWAVSLGIVLMATAWGGWIMRSLAGAPDSIEPMDFLLPAGVLIAGYGGVTWTLKQSNGLRYERFSRATADWLPIVAVVGCVVLDVMPRTRSFEIDPIALGTCSVVLLAMVRQRALQGRERHVSERLTSEMSERAATTISLARLEAGATVEETAERICAEALNSGGIDSAVVLAFTPKGVVPLAEGGISSRPLTIGCPLPEGPARELTEHAELGLWLESWAGRTPRDEFDRAIVESGLRVEALVPLIWNDQMIGLLAMGAATPEHARRLSERLATLTEFSVISAAVLGPMLNEMGQREKLQAEVEAIIATQAFHPVFQPIVDLTTRTPVGFEALVRFDAGIRPDLCFVAADKVGMMVKLETAVLRVQVEQARDLPAGCFLSLNVSPALATASTPLLDVLSEAAQPIVLEVTEHAAIDDYEKLKVALELVRPGAMVAIDDAGAGYAGLHHILELHPEYVKLDISLVRNIDTDPARQAMVKGMAFFAESVGCALIAEGIETENERTALNLLGIQFGQGYLLGRPEPLRRPPRIRRRRAQQAESLVLTGISLARGR